MHSIDVFNGDADGICALVQLRLHAPRPGSRLVTGVKRDIRLLKRLTGVVNSELTVLDISLDRNREDLERLLAAGNRVLYIDHHYSGALPVSSRFDARIDPSPRVCTALLVDRMLSGQQSSWAIAGAFGDNLDEIASAHAKETGLDAEATRSLHEIGLLLNYNGYGSTLSDLLVHPADLFIEALQFEDPLVFHRDSSLLEKIRRGYHDDIKRVAELQPMRTGPAGRVFQLPEADWARRVVGVFSNQIARDRPEMAHAVLIANQDRSWLVSVRAPLASPQGADALCRQFLTGGGRAGAAGINRLASQDLEVFLSRFFQHFS
ncbi:acetyltransferase [Desulfobulbus alkaliphilus]|uniref:acetyltransferase n=1 Tax=Desulfobulbus alkaliphilus TaxID=869814 RepID=UPI0019637AD8|nr:acetyltransferase [Desulfobulbus alkaliphilus]MBM9536063.1 acetyltransferase [Desulfobulbus alkaliphilus]